MFHRNLPLKTASLLLAIFLWFWVLLSEQNPIIEQTLSKVPVTAEGIQPGLALEGDVPSVDVRVKGLKQDMLDLRGSVRAFVSCRNLRAGSYRLGVQVRPSEDVSVVWTRPADIPVVIEEIVSESRTAQAKMVGEPPAGYELIGATISPKVVKVSGSRTRVDQASRVMVTVDLRRIVPGVASLLPAHAVESTGAAVRGLTLTPPQVSVLADLKPVVASKVLPVFVRTRGLPPADLHLTSVEADPPMVTAVLPASRVTEMTHVDTQEIDLGTAKGSFTRSVGLVVPEGVSLLSDSKVTVSVRLVHAPPRPPAQQEEGGDPPAD